MSDTSFWQRHPTMRVSAFAEAAGFSRRLTYDLIGAGELESIKIGKARLIVTDSYRRLIARRLAEQGAQ